MEFDNILRSITSEVLNVNLVSESAWLQASLPVSEGGLGIRSAAQLAPSALLASAAGCASLSKDILPTRLHCVLSPESAEALALWNAHVAVPPPESPDDCHQKAWDSPQVSARLHHLLENVLDPASRARLLAASCKESGAWLNAPPVSSLGLRMDDDTISIAVSLRLGTPLCRPHPCIQCGVPVDESAVNALSCRKSGGQHVRHNAMNDVICRSLTAAGIPCQTEPHSLVRSDGKHPDGVTMLPWKSGRPLVWDATCSDTFAPSYVSLAASRAGAVAEMAENRKSAKYTHLQSTHLFVPISAKTSGVFGEESLHFLRELARRVRDRTGEPDAFQHLLQRLSVAIQRGNAISIVGTFEPSLSSDLI